VNQQVNHGVKFMKNRLIIYFIGLLMVVFAIAETAQAERLVSGEVTGLWTREASPYTLTGPTNVPDHAELVIEPGVRVRSRQGDALIIYGRLIAEGTEEDSIIFVPVGWLPFWGGVRFFDADSGSRLSYCVFRQGQRLHGSQGDTLRSGGNMLLWHSDVTINHSSFLDGEAAFSGGGLAIIGGASTISNCLFQNNTGYVAGGVSCLDSCQTTFDNCDFRANSADWGGGGGFIGEYSSPVFNECRWNDNYVESAEAGSFGGALFIYTGADPLIRKNCFTSNHASRGGAIYVSGFGCAPRITWSDFFNNHTEAPGAIGGAICISGGAPVQITYCRFLDNSASVGGAVYLSDQPRANLHNSLFNSNTAASGGGAICMVGDFEEERWAIDRCTFVGNNQLSDNDISPHTLLTRSSAYISLSTCIVTGSNPVFDAEFVESSYSLIQGGAEGEGNLDADPCFYEHDDSWRMLCGDSPCIDSGDELLPPDPDGSRADRGWLSFPHNALANLPMDTVTVEMLTGEEQRITVRLQNRTGLPFYASLRDVLQIELGETIDVSTVTGDDELFGAVWCGDGYYLCGTGAANVPMIYHLNRDFQLVSQFPQPGNPIGAGFFDLASDGHEVLWGGDTERIVEFTTGGEFGDIYNRPDGLQSCTALAMDERFAERIIDFYVGDSSGSVVRCGDDFGAMENFQVEMNLTALAMRRNARAIYAMSEKEEHMELALINPATGSVSQLGEIEMPDGYHPGGCEVGRGLTASTDKLVGLLRGDARQGQPDLLFQSDLYPSWLGLIPEHMLLKPWQTVVWEVIVTGVNIEPGEYIGAYQVAVNGWGEPGQREVRLRLAPNEAPAGTSLPKEFTLSAYPNPFNGQLSLRYNIQKPGRIKINILDIAGRPISQVEEGYVLPGSYVVSMDLTALPSGSYFARLDGGTISSTIPLTCIK
jgi:predicted outer membrane repeat protein